MLAAIRQITRPYFVDGSFWKYHQEGDKENTENADNGRARLIYRSRGDKQGREPEPNRRCSPTKYHVHHRRESTPG